MAMSHAECTHPRTPAGRAACRKLGGRTPAGDRPTHVTAEIDTSHWPADKRGPLTTVRTGGGKGVQFDVEPRPARGPRAVRANRNERAGDVLTARTGIPGDMPDALSVAVHLAWERGWAASIGVRYNDTEKRVVLTTPHGEVALVWKAGVPSPVWGVFFRAADSSIARRMDTVNEALRLAAGEDA